MNKNHGDHKDDKKVRRARYHDEAFSMFEELTILDDLSDEDRRSFEEDMKKMPSPILDDETLEDMAKKAPPMPSLSEEEVLENTKTIIEQTDVKGVNVAKKGDFNLDALEVQDVMDYRPKITSLKEASLNRDQFMIERSLFWLDQRGTAREKIIDEYNTVYQRRSFLQSYAFGDKKNPSSVVQGMLSDKDLLRMMDETKESGLMEGYDLGRPEDLERFERDHLRLMADIDSKVRGDYGNGRGGSKMTKDAAIVLVLTTYKQQYDKMRDPTFDLRRLGTLDHIRDEMHLAIMDRMKMDGVEFSGPGLIPEVKERRHELSKREPKMDYLFEETSYPRLVKDQSGLHVRRPLNGEMISKMVLDYTDSKIQENGYEKGLDLSKIQIDELKPLAQEDKLSRGVFDMGVAKGFDQATQRYLAAEGIGRFRSDEVFQRSREVNDVLSRKVKTKAKVSYQNLSDYDVIKLSQKIMGSYEGASQTPKGSSKSEIVRKKDLAPAKISEKDHEGMEL